MLAYERKRRIRNKSKAMMTKFYFVRHGKSEASVQGIVQGRGLKIPLAPEGIKQSKEIAKKLKDFKFDKIFTSTCKRALQTAEIIKKYHPKAPLIKVAQLYERSKGKAEGMTKEEFNEKYSNILKQWDKEIDARVEDGENFEDVDKRVMPIIRSHLKKYKGQSLLYVIHGNVTRVIIGHVLEVPFRFRPRIKQDYCALNLLTYDHERRRWSVEYVNKSIC